jgi:hypothetical protein
MVQSRLNSQIQYKESREIDPEDIGHSSSVYALKILNTEVAVLLGKLKYTYSNKGVVYVPIYAVSKLKVRSKIGVFEFESTSILNAYVDGELNIDKLTLPLLFDSFVNDKFVGKLDSDPKQYLVPVSSLNEMVEVAKKSIMGDDDDEDARFHVSVPAKQVSEELKDAREAIESGVFSIDRASAIMEILPEESEQEAETIRKEFRESSTNNWVEKYMKNNHYNIHENEGSGDCLFAVIRDAFKQIGRTTTVDKMRAILSNEITDEVFQEQYRVYLQFESNIKEYQKEMDDMKKNVSELKKRVKKMDENAEEAKHLLQQAKDLTKKHNEIAKKKKDAEAVKGDYIGFMKDIDTLDKMRAYIRSQNYWADTWAISTLERVLNIKLIIFSQDAYSEKAYDSVLNCGEANKEIQEKGSFSPEYYIMTSLHQKHYRLVSYKQKQILLYREIPYDVKMMILNKCLEKNAGIYYMIQDFRNLKSKLGISPDEGKPEDDEDLEGEGRLFRSNVVFVFYSNAEKSAKPGTADGEKIPKDAKIDYIPLSKIPEWRKKLDDSWMGDASIRIDNHNWSSVSHYLEGAKYKKGYPDIYLQYSLDSGSELSKDPKPDKAGKKLKIQGDLDKKPKAIKVDVDYALGRDLQERELALRAKFEDNEDYRNLLLLTKTALLKLREKRGSPAIPDMLLMKIRHDIST